ncbi:hypothetical protein MO973_41755 [Paenibacillus sp. TRM 82003]|uniref:hypothetical protein n=1 Tax=Kineococcus sp. TRM81007 TaxID=2925831 RepID=UPI001F57053C|nr:hypothetical protein [Kineococcus sp. TRM81007]MCI2239717.1 hypothetical protein [Kineococcus sp. TRM81007]MCI3926720.1 hypothetical protein [Paenibacillus sp. TRM 82003]
MTDGTSDQGSGARGVRLPMALLLGQAVAGPLLGVLWWALARRPAPWLVGEPVVVTGAAYPIARDGSFAALTALAGLVAGALVLRWAREHPLPVMVAGLTGALAGSLLTVATAGVLPPSDPSALAHVSVYAWAVVLVQPLVVSVVVAVVSLAGALVAWTRSEA